jgi:hypothetical protein
MGAVKGADDHRKERNKRGASPFIHLQTHSSAILCYGFVKRPPEFQFPKDTDKNTEKDTKKIKNKDTGK